MAYYFKVQYSYNKNISMLTWNPVDEFGYTYEPYIWSHKGLLMVTEKLHLIMIRLDRCIANGILFQSAIFIWQKYINADMEPSRWIWIYLWTIHMIAQRTTHGDREVTFNHDSSYVWFMYVTLYRKKHGVRVVVYKKKYHFGLAFFFYATIHIRYVCSIHDRGLGHLLWVTTAIIR